MHTRLTIQSCIKVQAVLHQGKHKTKKRACWAYSVTIMKTIVKLVLLHLRMFVVMLTFAFILHVNTIYLKNGYTYILMYVYPTASILNIDVF